MWQSHLISHSFPVPVSRSLQAYLLASQPTKSATGGGGALWRACNLTWFSPCLTGLVDYLFASRHKGHRFKSPGGYLVWNRDSPVSVVSLHWWPWRDWSSLQPRLLQASCQKLSLGPHANNVIIPLDLTQLFCPGFTLTAGPPSSFTIDRVGCWGGGSPVESLQSHMILTMSHWSSGLTCLLPVTRDPGSNPQGGTYVKPGFSC